MFKFDFDKLMETKLDLTSLRIHIPRFEIEISPMFSIDRVLHYSNIFLNSK